MRFRRIWKYIYYTIFLIFFTVIAAEIILRIYNPFPMSVTGDKITLHPNTKRIMENVLGPDLDTTVVVEKNSLAFRGPEPPKDLENYLSIFTIGGSTTECIIINQDKTWPTLLSNKLSTVLKKVWLNNVCVAGRKIVRRFWRSHSVRPIHSYCSQNCDGCLWFYGFQVNSQKDRFARDQLSWSVLEISGDLRGL